jgi:hypothetical protein
MNKLRREEPQQRGGIDSTECGLSTVERSSGDNCNELEEI